MSDFAPSAQNSGGAPVNVSAYPDGDAGIRLSLEEVAKKIREGRLDPAVRGWAGDVLIAADRPKSVADQASAILAAFRHQTVYVSDPAGAEYIASAAATLCLRPGLCVRARDCDDSVVAVGAALMSIGIPVRVVKQYFGASHQQHVLLEFQNEMNNWIPMDPSTDSRPVGFKHSAVEEVRIDPMDVVGNTGTAGAEIVTLGKPLGGCCGSCDNGGPCESGIGASPRTIRYAEGVWWEWRYGRLYYFMQGRWWDYAALAFPTGPIKGPQGFPTGPIKQLAGFDTSGGGRGALTSGGGSQGGSYGGPGGSSGGSYGDSGGSHGAYAVSPPSQSSPMSQGGSAPQRSSAQAPGGYEAQAASAAQSGSTAPQRAPSATPGGIVPVQRPAQAPPVIQRLRGLPGVAGDCADMRTLEALAAQGAQAPQGLGDSGGVLPPGNWTLVPDMHVQSGLRYVLIFGVAAKPAGLPDSVWGKIVRDFIMLGGFVTLPIQTLVAWYLSRNGAAPVTSDDIEAGMADDWLVESVTKASEDSVSHVTSWVVQAVAKKDQTLGTTKYVTFTAVYRQGSPNNAPPQVQPPQTPPTDQQAAGVGIGTMALAGLAVGAVGGLGYALWRRSRRAKRR